jgi:hypothetical protein
MPDATRPIGGLPPGSSRDLSVRPGFDVVFRWFRHFIGGSLAFVFLVPI